MLRNYFLTAIRSFLKNKTYSFLNVFGLSIGIACASLIFLWVEDEMTFDHHFKKRNNIYKVIENQFYDGLIYTFHATPGPLSPALKQEVPGIKNSARMNWGSSVLFSLGEKRIYEQGYYTDSALFSMFTLKFIKGNPLQAFKEKHSIVLSESMAQKFFGTKDVLGKTLNVDADKVFMISGVFEDLPKNVSLHFEWLSPFSIYLDQNPWLKTSWTSNSIQTLVELEPKANVSQVGKKMLGFLKTKDHEIKSKLLLFSMNDWRLFSRFKDGKQAGGRILQVRMFSIIAWLILLIACINFMNLATARSEQRAREVGVRKVLGAEKKTLVFQFLGEAFLMSFVSTALALGFVIGVLPSFNTLIEKELLVNITEPGHILTLLVIAIVCGLLAGSYPSLYLSSFNPIKVFKGLRIGRNNSSALIRKSLVVIQFTVSIVLIISTIIIYRQIQFAKNRELGFNKENSIYFDARGKIKEHFTAMREDLLGSGVVENATLSGYNVLEMGSNGDSFTWKGKDPNKGVLVTFETGDENYLATTGMTLKTGRNFYDNTDTTSVLINEAFAEILGKGKDVTGLVLTHDKEKTSYTVAGVIHNFVYNNVFGKYDPLMLFNSPKEGNVVMIRLKQGRDLQTALSKIETIVKAYNPGYPFEYKFLDATFDEFFKVEKLVENLAKIFSGLTIFISCLGLFGLAAYTAERRTKEIGIRKVLGASVSAITSLLAKDFIKLVVLSLIIAVPIAWYSMHSVLQEFDYRIDINISVFVLSGILAILIALLTVSFQSVKAAIANPVKSLRSE